MDKRQKDALIGVAEGRVTFDPLMAQYTTFRVGGPADALYEAQGLEDLKRVIRFLAREAIPYLILGYGSNLLVLDGGIEGVAILLKGELALVEETKTPSEDDRAIFAGAGLSIAELLGYCRKSGLTGLEFLAGIPGTVGGAIVMNAGAFRMEIEAKVREIQIVNREGQTLERDRSMLRFSYRKLELEKGSVVTGALLTIEQASKSLVAERLSDCLKKRKSYQGLKAPSAGSVFRNPPCDYAGRLIETVGLKGKKIGGAMISPRHANIIVNVGSAKAEDILALMGLAREKVREQTGIDLLPEIHVVGHQAMKKCNV
jgi:UDP-N-acetylmuramate dehydrogenase